MAKLTKYCLLLCASCLAAVSCSTDMSERGDEPQSPYLQEISVLRAPLVTAAGEEEESVPYDGEDIVDVEFTPGQSILYVSQRTKNYHPFEQGIETYHYVYYNNPNADWNEGFNFHPRIDTGTSVETENPNALNWETVGRNGSVGNGFALYAMYYPSQEPTQQVATDQSTLEALKSSDILGAYHSTSALYSRVRFKLHHLMVYFKVNLYVPVLCETWLKGENQGFSGYTAESLIEALVKNACPDFELDWAASISSDASPSVSLPSNYAENLKDIPMYSHAHLGDEIRDETQPDSEEEELTRAENAPGEDGEDDGDETDSEEGTGSAIRPVKKTRIDIAQFLPKEVLDIQPMDPAEDGKMYDEVFQFSFSIIVPAQYSDFMSQSPGVMKFGFEKPSTKITKNYYFSSGFAASGTIKPNKGTLQVLNLYLPRKGDEVILVGAEIQDWTNVETDMNLTQKDNEEPKE